MEFASFLGGHFYYCKGLGVIAGTTVVKDSHQLDTRTTSASFPEEIDFSFSSS